MQVSTREIASAYRSLGWATVRVLPLSKKVVDDAWPQIDYPPEAFADGDNIGIKLGVPSGGLVDVDLDCPEAIALAPLYLPQTASFGRSGQGKTPGVVLDYGDFVTPRHYLYRAPVKTKKLTRAHVEIRSSGLQTVFPGSVHESGVPIVWTNAVHPLEISEESLFGFVGCLALATVVGRVWPSLKGTRHHAILAIAGALWHAGWTLDQALRVLLPPVSLDGTRDGHRESAIRSTWDESIEKQRTGWPTVRQILGDLDAAAIQRAAEMVPTVPRWKAAASPTGKLELHDVGNAERFLVEYGGDLRFVRGLGWLQWDGCRWAQEEPTALVIRSIRTLDRLGQEKQDPQIIKWAHTSMSAGRISSAKSLAAEIGDRVDSDALDARPWLLNCPNGVVDLRTGMLEAHDRTHLHTRMTKAVYDPSAAAPRFIQFLHEIFLGNNELALYVLRYLGYALTGDVREQVFQLWYGHGANGKTTLIELLLYVFGDYGQRMADDLLTARRFGKDSSAPSPDVARMRGSRFTAGSEADQNTRWNEPLVKSLTGSDRVVARHLKKEPIEFDPTWKIVLAVNHRPIVRGTDHGIWRRIHLVPFDASFTGARLDPTLLSTLKQEANGILALLVRACIDWQHYGLRPPTCVQAAVREYRNENDVIGAFLHECTRQEEKGSVAKTQMYRAFRLWARESGEYEFSKHTFVRMLLDRGVGQSRDEESWIGLTLIQSSF